MKFTVVIPSRERADTLYYALKTCVTQDYDNLEILISDNFSNDNTREVVESFNDSRIRYVNTGKRVSMASNWEFALSHVNEGYVSYLGDDDGLMPKAIADLDTILQKHPVEAISWRKVDYHWPSHPRRPNYILVPLQRNLVRTSCKKYLRAAINNRAAYNRGPCLYNGAVSIQPIATIRSKNRQFFASPTPDIFSSYALTSVIDTFLYSERPFSINGASRHSNGTRWMQPVRRGHESEHGDGFLAENDRPPRDLCPIIPGSIRSGIFEALVQANDNCYEGKLRIPLRKHMAAMIKEAAAKDAETHWYIMQSLEKVARAANVTISYRICKALFPNLPKQHSLPPVGLLADYSGLVADLTAFGIDNVADAAVWVEAILGRFEIPFKLQEYSFCRRYTSSLVRRLMVWLGKH